jgi:hypothetical protein
MCGLRFTLLGNESRFFTRPNINPHQINTDLLREWREQCDSEEGERRQPFLQDHSIMNSRDVGGTTLRVIDIETDCVIPAPRDCSYVALSYVWGDVTPIKLTKAALNRGFQEQESPKSARFQLYREELPKTIQDALLAVMLIGKRYLWVDCLCIVQDDEHERMDTIHNMHYIYAAASLTIIAAGGSDANAGLPGLGQGTRNIQPLRASVDGVELVEIDPPLSLESTVWGSRGWTYQEYQFSIRALIFVNERVYFQCIHGCYGETRLTWPFRGPPKINSVDSRLSSLEEFEKYLQHVQEYSKRVLTYEEDVLNAFSAILEDYATRNNTGLCWGLPQDRFSLALMWVNNIESPNRVIPIRRRSQGPNHIHPFPSWSWAGWVGSIHYPMQDSGDSFVHRFESAVVWPWEEGYDVVSESDPNLTGLLSISVRMVILKFEDTEEVERPLLYRFNDGRTWSSGSLECFFLGRIRDDMAARQTNKHIHKSQILLIIEPDESGIYRRKGLMRVSTNFLASALSETRRIILG